MSMGQLPDERQNSLDASYLPESGRMFRLMPVLLALIVGMLIMLLIVHFFPRDNGQSATQSAEATAAEESADNSASSNALPASAPALGSANLGPIQTTSTTASGYPVVSSGAPRAVDYLGQQEDIGDVSNQPSTVSTQDASTSPCVDPPSTYGRSYRQVDR